MSKKPSRDLVKNIKNRRALYDYQIKDKILAGIALKGVEVVGLRRGKVSLKGAFVEIKDNQAYLKNLQIFSDDEIVASGRHRLLLTKKQIKAWQKDLQAGKGNTVIPLQILISGRYIKVEIALAAGRKQYDKRQVLREKSDRKQSDKYLKRS